MKRTRSDLRRPVLANLLGSRMVQRLVMTGAGVAIARDPTAMAWLKRLRDELLAEERCAQPDQRKKSARKSS